jgi:hypothetical protein
MMLTLMLTRESHTEREALLPRPPIYQLDPESAKRRNTRIWKTRRMMMTRCLCDLRQRLLVNLSVLPSSSLVLSSTGKFFCVSASSSAD